MYVVKARKPFQNEILVCDLYRFSAISKECYMESLPILILKPIALVLQGFLGKVFIHAIEKQIIIDHHLLFC